MVMKSKTLKNVDEIVKGIKDANLPQRDFVKMMETFHDPFKVLICCILSLRTNDLTTYPCSLRMLDLGTTPKDFLNVDVDTLAKAIYPVGFYKNKAQQILDISKELVEIYDIKVPYSIEELIKFKCVGRKTANLDLAKGFGIPAICVDVHVHRISNEDPAVVKEAAIAGTEDCVIEDADSCPVGGIEDVEELHVL